MDNHNPLTGGNFQPRWIIKPQLSSSPGKKAYLENRIEVLRCEGTAHLHESIIAYRNDASQIDERDTFVYTQVFIKGCTLTRRGVAFRVEFSTARSRFRVKWESSNRLREGTIVALTPSIEGFRKKCIIAVVANRTGVLPKDASAAPPHIDVFFANPDEAIIDPSTEFVMIEARGGYYESVRHAIDGLQKAFSEISPLDRYIIGRAADVDRPRYLHEFAENGAGIKSRLANPDAEIEIDDLIHAIAAKGDLDLSQICAIKNVLDSEIAIIQGPPGTGKTFTAVAVLRLLVDIQESADPKLDKGPIVVAAQSNFALDQLLLRCDRAGISFCRLGGRTRDDKIRSQSVFKLGNPANPLRWRQMKELKRLEKQFQSLVNNTFFNQVLDPADLHGAGILTDEQFRNFYQTKPSHTPSDDEQYPCTPLAGWLAGELTAFNIFYPSLDYQEDFPMDDDSNMNDELRDAEEPLVGEWYSFNLSWTGYIHPDHDRSWMPRAVEDLHLPDLWAIPDCRRGGVYVYLQKQWFEHQAIKFRGFLKNYDSQASLLKQDNQSADANDIRAKKIQIIGCTTTGLGKNRQLLEHLAPKILLVEEAAETWEANVTSALLPSLQHLILVGDHIQLTPKASVAGLAFYPYDLNISLFQRLIIQGHPRTTLQVQRRMIPEIRGIVDPFYDNTLQDDASVLTRGPIPGMKHNMFWMHHASEHRTNAVGSKYNEGEAQHVVGLSRYLLQNGMDAKRITILTFYRGQQAMICKKLRQDPITGANVGDDKFQVRTVDSYQGEENDVVILSLVRSREQKSYASLGFLDSKNRVVVAMSRARSGFYIIGDVTNVLDTDLWTPITQYFANRGVIEESVSLKCQKHGHETQVQSLEDWALVAEGGCGKLCTETICSAGHACNRPCHAKPHDGMHCTARCEETLRCGHRCIKACGDDLCECNRGASCQTRNLDPLDNWISFNHSLQAGSQDAHTRHSQSHHVDSPDTDSRDTRMLRRARDDWARQADQMSPAVRHKLRDGSSHVDGPRIIETFIHRPIEALLPCGQQPVAAPTRVVPAVLDTSVIDSDVVESDPAMWDGLRYFDDINQALGKFEENVEIVGRDRAIDEEMSRHSASEGDIWARTLIDY